MSNLRFRTPQEALEHLQRREAAARPKWDRVSAILEGNLDRTAELRRLLEQASDEDPALKAQVATGASGTVERTRT